MVMGDVGSRGSNADCSKIEMDNRKEADTL